jgi:hypothetical protein
VRLSLGGDPGDMSMASPESGSPETGGGVKAGAPEGFSSSQARSRHGRQ